MFGNILGHGPSKFICVSCSAGMVEPLERQILCHGPSGTWFANFILCKDDFLLRIFLQPAIAKKNGMLPGIMIAIVKKIVFIFCI
jgi:hypothetical protein